MSCSAAKVGDSAVSILRIHIHNPCGYCAELRTSHVSYGNYNGVRCGAPGQCCGEIVDAEMNDNNVIPQAARVLSTSSPQARRGFPHELHVETFLCFLVFLVAVHRFERRSADSHSGTGPRPRLRLGPVPSRASALPHLPSDWRHRRRSAHVGEEMGVSGGAAGRHRGPIAESMCADSPRTMSTGRYEEGVIRGARCA